MDIRRFTLIIGIVFLTIGILGFVPAFVVAAPGTEVGFMAHGLLFGLFPINGLHNLVHIAFGAWGVIVYRNAVQARLFCRTNAIVYGLLAVLGFVPGINTMNGFLPIHGHDIWLHGIIALSTGYYGFVWQTQFGRKLGHQN